MGFWRGLRVLVTGGNGFIGSHLVESLVERGAVVTSSASSDANRFRYLDRVRDDIRVVVGDLRVSEVAERATKGQEVVMHLAARVGGIAYNVAHPAMIFRDNMLTTISVVDAARQGGVAKLVITSSACVYPRFCSVPTPEEEGFRDRPEPTNEGYGWAKRMSEFLGSAYAKEFEMVVRIARPDNAYGPRDNFSPESSHVIPSLIRRTLAGENPLMVWGDGTATRSFLYVSDFVDGLLVVAEKSPQVDAINLGAAEEVSIRDLAEHVVRLCGTSTRITFDPSRPSGQPRRCSDTWLAQQLLGFEPHVSLEQGLRETIRWYQESLARA